MMRQQKGKKILIYLLLFLVVGSINNTFLTKIKFEEIKSIQISGLNKNQNMNILKSIKNLNLKNIFFLNGNEISKIIGSNSLVENYEIFKKYPYALDIKIDLPKKKLNEVLEIANKAHKIIKCRGVTRSDFKYFNGKFYLLEINTQPGMTKLSLVPEIAAHYGMSFIELIEWILKDASNKR